MKRIRQYIIRFWNEASSFLKSKRKAVIISLINALFLTVVTYFMNNSPLFTGEKLNLYAGMEFIKGLFVEDNTAKDSVLLINVAYDKQLARKKINGITVGSTDVTDRKALIELLKNLRQNDNYRYIFMDIRFEKGDETEYDDSLYKEIYNTPRLLIANHKDIELASEILKKRAAYSDYYVTILSTNFVRYRYLRGIGESMPLRAYRELFNDSITKCGWFYFCNEGLCQNSLVIKSPIKRIENEWVTVDENKDMKQDFYLNLNKINDETSLSVLSNRKYVVIGNMVDDNHDTYYGRIPGSIIVFSAFWALKNHKHEIRPWFEILLFLLFFCISLSLFSRIPVIERVRFIRKIKSKFLRFVLSFLGYSTVLFLATIFLYLCFDIIPSIWVPALFFSIQKTYFNFKYMKV